MLKIRVFPSRGNLLKFSKLWEPLSFFSRRVNGLKLLLKMPSLRSKTSPYMDIKIRRPQFAEFQQNFEPNCPRFQQAKTAIYGRVSAPLRPQAQKRGGTSPRA